MTPNEFVEVVRSTTYKPDWTFEARVMLELIEVGITGTVLHSDLGTPTRVFSVKHIHGATIQYAKDPVNLARDWLRGMILEMEAHEVDEWLRFDGQRFRDPHPELAQKRMLLDMERLPNIKQILRDLGLLP